MADPNIFQMQEQELATLMTRFEQLRRKYDQYFLGMESREPGFLRENLERDMRKTRLLNALQSATRFRYKQFQARYRTYAGYWDRVLRELEEGTYRRGSVTQAERLATAQAEAALRRAEGVDPSTGRAGAGDGVASGQDLSADAARVLKASNVAGDFLAAMLKGKDPYKQASASRTRGGVKELYDAYVKAKQARGEDVSRISLSSFTRSVKKQRERAREKLGTEVEVRLKVTDQKVTLVAARKRGPKPSA